MTRARSIVMAALVVGLVLSCTNPMRDTLEAVVQQFSTAQYELSFHDNAGIADTSVIVITFSESMDTDTLECGGTLFAESDGGAWSDGEFPDDTLTISPVSVWTQGGNRTLTVDVDDLQTYPAADISLSYGVLNGIIYVHPNGSDEYYGTFDLPKATIQAAIDDAEAAYDGAEVWVAEGTYELSESIIISEDISLLGGFSPVDWAIRETDTDWAITDDLASDYPTEIRYPSVSGVISVSIYQATGSPLVDGFTILGPTGTDSTCVQVYDSTATISSCSIHGGLADASIGVVTFVADVTVEKCNIDGGSTDLSTGLFSYQATPSISDCIINGGSGQQTSAVKLLESDALIQRSNLHGGFGNVDAAGIYAEDGSHAIIRNNLIKAGDGSSTFGIWVKASDPLIQNNIIHGGGASIFPDSIAAGIHVYAGSSATIENNIISIYSGTNQHAIETGDSSSTPAVVRNNCIFDQVGLDYAYLDIDGGVARVTALDLNAELFATANIPDDPNINWTADWSNDWRGSWNFTAAPPGSIVTGGVDLTAQFDDDINGGATRSNWSIGAYEF